jgi:hypothetical protein
MNSLLAALSICATGFTPMIYQGEKICVMQDYYQVNDIRTPLSYPDAMKIANENGWELPTKDLVDAIWLFADCKMKPIYMTPDSGMTSTSRYTEHDAMIDAQLGDKDCSLIAGHKKDVIGGGTNYVTIYGWHRRNGQPTQPVYSGHDASYYDYSHGVRFVYRP